MIKVTRLNGKEFILNAERIQTVEATPDCVITMHGGDKYVVQEAPDVIISRAIDYGRTLRGLVD